MDKFTKVYLNIITEQTKAMEELFSSKIPEAQSKFYFLKMFHDSLLADTLAKYFLNGELQDEDDPRIDVLADLFKKSYIDRTEIRHNNDSLDDLIFKLQSNVFTMKSNRGRHTAYQKKPNFRKAQSFDNGVTIYQILGDTPEEINERTMEIIKKYWGSVISIQQLAKPRYVGKVIIPNRFAVQGNTLLGVQNYNVRGAAKEKVGADWLNKRGRRQPYLVLKDGTKFDPWPETR